MSRKTKRFTRRQLHRLALRQRREERELAAEEKSARYRLARREQRALSMFKGCDPERTLDLLGEEV